MKHHTAGRTIEERLEQDGQGTLFPTKRRGAGGYRKGVGRPRRRPVGAAFWGVWVTPAEKATCQKIIKAMREKEDT